jgi:hypothetical protein
MLPRVPPVRKHQVCDRCGGPFGMITHRWWGNKFCKRTCKDACLREVMLDRDAIRRWMAVRGAGTGKRRALITVVEKKSCDACC